MSEQNNLTVIWTSGDRDVALKAAFMYTQNSKLRGWWNQVRLIIWGPSAKLLCNDPELQERIRLMIHIGVVVEACKGCSDEYGVSTQLEELGVDVKYVGGELTDILQEGGKVLTF